MKPSLAKKPEQKAEESSIPVFSRIRYCFERCVIESCVAAAMGNNAHEGRWSVLGAVEGVCP